MEKKENYELTIKQIIGVIEGEDNLIANLSNIAAIIKSNLDFFWIGFYIVSGVELVLGPFQGPVACTRIAHGKGVCGTSWRDKAIINVPDVEEFPGHIACNENSKSELVIPVFDKKGEVMMVLDADSDRHDNFDIVDEHFLADVGALITEKHG